MPSRKLGLSPKAALPFQSANKHRRQSLHVNQKKARGSEKREKQFRRRKEEDKDPGLREERIRRNAPLTIDRKRTWDNIEPGMEDDALGASVDVGRLKRQKLEDAEGALEAATAADDENEPGGDGKASEDEDHDSMIDSDSELEDEEGASPHKRGKPPLRPGRALSPVQSTTSTNFDLTPEALAARFPSLFTMEVDKIPKVLITTSINSTLHGQARLLTQLFPNSVYIPRSSHRYGHKFSIREISSFATNRNYTAVLVLNEDQKRPCGIDFVHLPQGPMFHFTISNWVDGKKIPGHGNPTNHHPELILNNFRTPLGLLTAHLFRTMFPPQPEFLGRQVVTLHNQRDYIFLRRHRYVFRDKRETEKSVVGADGKEVKGVEEIRAGLQELGPRFTMKLRRVDRGIQRASGQEWEWKGKTDRVRTKFQL